MTVKATSTPATPGARAEVTITESPSGIPARSVDEEQRLSTSTLFASWAGENLDAWQQAVGAAVTHLSRGNGRVTSVSQAGDILSVHVRYPQGDHSHALWEFRTELTSMTLPNGLTRADLIPTVKARRLLRAQAKRTEWQALAASRQWHGAVHVDGEQR